MIPKFFRELIVVKIHKIMKSANGMDYSHSVHTFCPFFTPCEFLSSYRGAALNKELVIMEGGTWYLNRNYE